MADNIVVNIDLLEKTAESFSATGTKVSDITSDMITTVSALKGSFTGEIADRFQSKFSALETDMNTLRQNINTQVSKLNEMATIFKSAETTGRAAVDAAPTAAPLGSGII